jgi:hypothetical protein
MNYTAVEFIVADKMFRNLNRKGLKSIKLVINSRSRTDSIWGLQFPTDIRMKHGKFLGVHGVQGSILCEELNPLHPHSTGWFVSSNLKK